MSDPSSDNTVMVDGSEHTLDASLAGDPGTTRPGGFPVAHWARYEFLAILGHGGMGAVYRARDRQLGRDVALKFIRGGDPDLTLRLLREARAQARVDHPNICKVYEVGEVDGKAYIAMELVSGRSLRDAAAEMSLLDRVLAVRDAAFALHEAHKLGILHRDIKPANIMIECDDTGRRRPVVMDFGIARDQSAEHHTQTGALVGTPAYMSPEQARGRRDLDRRADVYSLGATLYDLLAGVPPFRADTPMQVVLQVLNDDPVPLRTHAPAVPDDLTTIVGKCLDKDPARRYDSARALAEDLDRYICGDPILGRKVSTFQRLLRRARKHRALVAITSLALVAVLFAAAYGITTRIAAREQAAAFAAEAELGRTLAQDAKEIEWLLRTAHLLPLHDTTPERALVRARMDQVVARPALPGIGAALVEYTLGRGHLALGDIHRAHDHLTRALNGGLDTPELHLALGLALGELYDEKAAEARRTAWDERLQRRLAALESEYLAPARAALDRARGARVEAASYLEGTIALYRRDYERALALARRAREEAAWSYESLLLAARVERARADDLERAGDRDAAQGALEAAARLLDDASVIARSDARIYEESAATWTRLMVLRIGPEFSAAVHLPHIVDRCERAAVARPDATTPYVRLAAAHYQSAGSHVVLGGDPREALAAALAATDRALAIDPADYDALALRIEIGSAAADHAVADGQDADALIADVNRAADRLLASHPERTSAIDHWTSARLPRIHRAIEIGDPSADIHEVLDRNWAAGERTRDAAPMEHLLDTYGIYATWLVSLGRDPGPPTARAEEALARCLESEPHNLVCPHRFTHLLLWTADHALTTGRDPRPVLALVRDRIHDDVPFHDERIHYSWIEVTDALRRGEDPGPALARWSAANERCDRQQGADFWPCRVGKAIHVVYAARAAVARGDGLAALVLARDTLGNEDAWDFKEYLAEVELGLATLAESTADRDRHLTAGLAAAARALELYPGHPRVPALQAGLHLLAAQTHPALRDESLRSARNAMNLARERNPWTHLEFAATVAALERTRE